MAYRGSVLRPETAPGQPQPAARRRPSLAWSAHCCQWDSAVYNVPPSGLSLPSARPRCCPRFHPGWSAYPWGRIWILARSTACVSRLRIPPGSSLTRRSDFFRFPGWLGTHCSGKMCPVSLGRVLDFSPGLSGASPFEAPYALGFARPDSVLGRPLACIAGTGLRRTRMSLPTIWISPGGWERHPGLGVPAIRNEPLPRCLATEGRGPDSASVPMLIIMDVVTGRTGDARPASTCGRVCDVDAVLQLNSSVTGNRLKAALDTGSQRFCA
jgi:hypothetical protein